MRRAAADSEPSATTAAKLRQRAQSGSVLAIYSILYGCSSIMANFALEVNGSCSRHPPRKEQGHEQGKSCRSGSQRAYRPRRGGRVPRRRLGRGGMARSDRRRTPGIRYVQGDSDSVEDMRRAIGDARIVVNALNMRYDQWFEGRMEAQMARVLEAMGRTGKTMLFPGNIYNFSASDRVMTPDLPQRPQTVRGALRVRVEQQFEAAAARGDVQVLIVRAGDFYGPASSGDWFDQVV